MRSIKIFALAFLLTSLAIAPAYAKRQCWDGPYAHDNDRGYRTEQVERLKEVLQLSAQQEADIRDIISERGQGLVALREAREANRNSLHELLGSDVLDEARLRDLVRKQAELKADKMVAQHATRTRINQVLTPEQRAKHEEFRQQRMTGRGEHRGHGSCAGPAGNQK